MTAPDDPTADRASAHDDPAGNAARADRTDLLEYRLTAAITQARNDAQSQAPATAAAWQRQEQYVQFLQRRRARRRMGLASVTGIAAAAAIVTAVSLDWPAGVDSRVQVLPAAPGQQAGIDAPSEQAQVYAENPQKLPDPLAAMTEGCAYDADAGPDADPAQRDSDLAAGVGARALQNYSVVYAAQSERSQAIGLRQNITGAEWLCFQTTGEIDGIVGIDQFKDDADLGSAWTFAPIPASDGNRYLVNAQGWTGGRIVAVTLTSPGGEEFDAVVQGDIWWATPLVDELDQAGQVTWTGYDVDGAVVASGRTGV